MACPVQEQPVKQLAGINGPRQLGPVGTGLLVQRMRPEKPDVMGPAGDRRRLGRDVSGQILHHTVDLDVFSHDIAELVELVIIAPQW